MQGKVDVQITMTARLNGVDVDDVARLQAKEPGELLGLLRERGTPTTVRVSEIYDKTK